MGENLSLPLPFPIFKNFFYFCLEMVQKFGLQPTFIFSRCVYVVGELSHIKEAHGDIISVVPLLREAARHRHYTHHVIFLETICKQVPVIAKNLGKKTFKTIVEDFFDIIFYSLV